MSQKFFSHLAVLFIWTFLSTASFAAIPKVPIGIDKIPEPKDEVYQANLTKELGLNFIHLTYGWAEPKPGEYTWSPFPNVEKDPYYVYLKTLKKMNFQISVTLVPVHMGQKLIPEYLKGSHFNDKKFLQRWRLFLSQFVMRYGDLVTFLNIGNEVNNYFGHHPTEWKTYLTLVKHSAQVIRASRKRISMGVVLENDALRRFWPSLKPLCNHLACTYYLPCSVFSENPSERALDPNSPSYFRTSFDGILRQAGTKPAVFTEVGCATHAEVDSSAAIQARFVEGVFDWLRRNDRRVKGLSWLSLRDWNYEGTRKVLGPGVGAKLYDHEPFWRFLTSLGLQHEDGRPKEGFKVFKRAMKAYRTAR